MIRLATALLIIGGLNWGLIGLFQYDLVASLFGGQTAGLSRIIYSLVGLAALYEIFVFGRLRRAESKGTVPEDIRRAA